MRSRDRLRQYQVSTRLASWSKQTYSGILENVCKQKQDYIAW